MKTRCLIIDDEPLAIEVIQSHIGKLNYLEVTATCQNAIEALEVLNRKKIDLIFLDIQMPGIKGTEFLKTLKNPPKVILTTAYREYAIEGYELEVIDYLLKPIAFERFLKAVNKYFQSNQGDIVLHHDESSNLDDRFIYVRVNKKVHKILLCDIVFAESLKDYVIIHTRSRKITAKSTITSFFEKLPETHFLRIHRSYIVALKEISGFTATSVDIGEKELPIGRSYKQQVFNVLRYSQFEE
jgi:DNA-binding LytR/AlgR family response regulator